ncbi:MAG: protein-L-isoaspartate(D-aspartate) O-methyltransferase [Gemmatimonadota bacterium]|nr:MAG: protein-L-isoaspartate(D-aspartate) O-methyltransferase [Gemmatimonadota bacterium]
MVDRQIRRRGISEPKVLEAMERVERHRFVPEDHRQLAYEDSALPIGSGQSISQPYIVAAMTEALELASGCRVLEVGTGSGYQTAVLAEFAAEVFTIERLPELSAAAQTVLEALDYDNIEFRVGDGSRGWPEEAPFDGIMVTAAAARVPEQLLEQLAEGSCLVIPVGGPPDQDLLQIRRSGNDFERKFITRCRFVPLIEDEAS